MAVRFSADGQDYTSTLSLGSISTFTICAWVQTVVDRNAISTAVALDNGASDGMQLRTDVNGSSFNYYDQSTSSASVTNQSNFWYMIAAARSGTTGTFYHISYNGLTLSSSAITGAATITANTLRIGESGTGGQWYNGSVCAVRLWTAQLTSDELLAESFQLIPTRTENLVCWFH